MENYYEKFKNTDLKNGNKYEVWFAENILKGATYEMNDDNKFDIKQDDKTYEVKTDSKSWVFYRQGFEVSSWGNKLSGINTSKADYWVNILPVFNKVVIIKLDDLKRLRSSTPNYVLRSCGDDTASKMMLWDYDLFMSEVVKYGGEIIDIKIPNFYGKEANESLKQDARNYINRQECTERGDENSTIKEHYKKLKDKLDV